MFSIQHDVEILADQQKVFDAISKPDHLVNWWPLRCQGQAKIGSTYNFYFTPEYDWYGRAVNCVAGRSFHIRMTKSDADWDPTTFGFDLVKSKNGTMLSFWHKGWPKENHHFKRASYCWALLLKGLKDYVEKGHIIPFKERS